MKNMKEKVGEFIAAGAGFVEMVYQGAKAGYQRAGIGGMVKGAIAAAVGGGAMYVGSVAQAAPDFSGLEAEISGAATSVAAVALVAIIAGFGIFVLIWGARKIKGALSSGG